MFYCKWLKFLNNGCFSFKDLYSYMYICVNQIMIATELTCQWRNGGCDHACSDTETGVNCTCYDGYKPINNQTCSGTKTFFPYMHTFN